MRLIQLTDAQAVWLHGVMQNPLSDDPNPANEDPVDAANRRAVYDATAEDVPYLTRERIYRAVREVKQAANLASELQDQKDFGSLEWNQLEAIDDRLHDALTALGE